MGWTRPESSDIRINNEEDWKLLKEHDGLVVVDVYSKWAGPCEIVKPIIMKVKASVSGT